MILMTIAVLKLALPFITAEEDGNNGILPLGKLGKAEHRTRIIIRVVIATIAADFAHLLRFLLHAFHLP